MFYIESERLRMIPLTHELLQLLHTNRQTMELALGLNISNPQISDFYKKEINDAMVNFWLPKTLANPQAYKWYTNWEIILKSDNISVGGLGFNGEPNEKGEAETGYMINEQHQNKGYATEALQLLSGWAFSRENVKAIIVHTYQDNLPSRRILSKCGFEEVEKDNDGLLTYSLKKGMS
ncbi:GNAT family N-acetyltransferase [Mucilaginibacter sp. OK098]|uniref:GNAT family N-acetyltransferase n=1 Tax=Mucilaginibacter sp. OK098 TaxID=1855297 RepID=UPI0009154059|nr:GNAT family N-acetyltransferase [Mucilaginibacter sp. OK098]SHN18491.1 Protein N-acetyltransferase, RimJ/RimL family [Mucilaginibacter sp. OK098]